MEVGDANRDGGTHAKWNMDFGATTEESRLSKWVLTKKKDAHGVVTRYKARVVAHGFSKIPSVDFKENLRRH